MTQSIDVNQLPSVKFDNELKSKIDYDTLDKFAKNTSDEDISSWITKFKTNTEVYFKYVSEQPPSSHDKGCRDFYYLTYNILNKIQLLRENFMKTLTFTEDIKSIRDKYMSSSSSFICNTKHKYLNYEEKFLDDFCEDINFINEKSDVIQISDQCQTIIDNISSRRVKLIGMKNFFSRGRRSNQITDTCNYNILEVKFPSFACTPNSRPELLHSASMESGHPTDSQQLGKGLGAQSFSPSGELAIDGQESFVNPEGGTNNVSPINEIISVSFPVLGVSVFSYLLYNFTSFGSKIQAFLKKKNDISINQYDNLTNSLSVDASNYEDIYSDNMQYNISYHNV
ncbi:PIR Superfamily Protein [Plasmodium ovale wallikeri]|uniref:PIR Superfamily Protein n=2 Tax=Plasmodium ovale TaxID=36330 RepID=A0A1A9A7D4_PLAOA|nr:PIR Superfamily Protein [Plasmodium ovale wallikeri]SBT55530.1 PIR Superfamily Protein [Plasmodium ovale wallikeri]SBT74121.1 PIR protein [Plasmodium ovale]